jgi:hypothetical protein
MRLHTLSAALCATTPSCLVATQADAASPAFTGPDFSGSYQCQGQDDHEGPYTGNVTLTLQKAHSRGVQAAYDFVLDVPGYGRYPGHAAAEGRHMAIHFALTDPSTQDYGTGIATFSKNKAGKWTFQKYYYEPAFKGGNACTETCTQR